MMLREERLQRISEQLVRERKVLCNELAGQFGLTPASIRLDLHELEQRGLATRVYGGAVLATAGQAMQEQRIAERLDLQRAAKEAIGQAAAALIADTETIMIDGGTTTIEVCRHLHDKHNLTVISCALHSLWQELASRSNLQVFITGGYLRPESSSLVGEAAENTLCSLRASKAILGIDGISLESGLTTFNFLEAGVKKRMIETSQKLVIVADHTKFGRVCPLPVAPVERASVIVTDAGISQDWVMALQERGVTIIVAEAPDAAHN